jgi:hypothetical protein
VEPAERGEGFEDHEVEGAVGDFSHVAHQQEYEASSVESQQVRFRGEWAFDAETLPPPPAGSRLPLFGISRQQPLAMFKASFR